MKLRKYANFVAFLCIQICITFTFGFTYQKTYTQDDFTQIECLGFDTLMSFPDKALDEKNNYSQEYDRNKITPHEFKKILEALYDNNYILISIEILINFDCEKITINNINLPPNKKPLILLFNNVTYKSSYQNLGNIDKIIIDRNNNLASYTKKKSIQDRVQYDNEFILILENFISTHPDFSFNNSRGIIFLSGENGILGYNTNMKNSSSRNECKRVKELIERLKLMGWTFGSNNYTYLDNTLLSDIEFAKSINLWDKEIRSLIGATHLYSYPIGKSNIGKSKKEMLVEAGYRAFFLVDNKNPNINITNDGLVEISYRKISGETLRQNEEDFHHLFDCEKVYDHENRKVIFNQLTQ